MPNRYRHLVKLDATGRVMETMLTSDRPREGWLKLDDVTALRARKRGQQLRILPNGRARELRQIRLSLSKRAMRADGQDTITLIFQGVPDRAGKVEVEVNGTKRRLSPKAAHTIGPTNRAGHWTIKLTDPRFWAKQDGVVLTALAEADGQEGS